MQSCDVLGRFFPRPACAVVAALAALGALSVARARSARAQEPEPAGGALDVDWRVHVPIAVAGGLAWVLSESRLKDTLADDRCAWCEGNAFDDHVRAGLRWSEPETAARLSDALVYGVAPASAFGLSALVAAADGRGSEWPANALAVLEATVLAADLAQLVKFQVGRARPYTREGGASAPVGSPLEDNLSFYSGHTSFAFSLAVSSGTVATMRGYRAAPAVWAVGLGAAATTGWLRVAADRHYASDVLTGALVGSAVGFAVPYLLHRRRGRQSHRSVEVAVAPAPGGALVLLGWRR